MTGQPVSKTLSTRALSRLPQYLRFLEALQAREVTYVTSAQLAKALGCSDALTRKDVAALGHSGRAGQGYAVEALHYTIARILGVTSGRRVLLVGADRKSTRLNSSHVAISYAVFCLKKKKKEFTRVGYVSTNRSR